MFGQRVMRRLHGASGAIDLRLAIALDAEDGVRRRVRRPAEEWIDVFPNDAAIRHHFEKAPEHAFVDERVAVAQAHRIRDPVAEEILRRAILILPDD